MVGSVEAQSVQEFALRVYLGSEVGWQAIYFVPKDLDHEQLTVGTASFGGKDRVSQSEFVRVNQEWCAKGR